MKGDFTMNIQGKKIYRKDRGILFGVCGGVAEFFNVDPNLVRLIWAVLALVTASLGFWAYVVAAFILPKESELY